MIFTPRYLWVGVDMKLGDAKNFFLVFLTFIYCCLQIEINEFAILGSSVIYIQKSMVTLYIIVLFLINPILTIAKH